MASERIVLSCLKCQGTALPGSNYCRAHEPRLRCARCFGTGRSGPLFAHGACKYCEGSGQAPRHTERPEP